ncbi:hypothetical protein L9F63_021720, partial [Diploptera punctata]
RIDFSRPKTWLFEDEDNRKFHNINSTLEDEDVDYQSEIDVHNSKASTGQYRSELSVASSHYLDTGYYRCVVNGTSLEDGEDNAASIYVYVQDEHDLLDGSIVCNLYLQSISYFNLKKVVRMIVYSQLNLSETAVYKSKGYEKVSGEYTEIPTCCANFDNPDEQSLSIWGKPDKVAEGDTITLFCGATKFNFSDDISWYVRRVGYSTKSLVNNKTGIIGFGGLAREDGSSSIRWREAPKEPKIISTNLNTSEMMVNTGTPVFMYCKADGLPVPTVKWYKDDALLSNYNKSRITIEKEKLTIPFAKLEDEGDYRCVVSNRINTASRSISLRFKDKPGANLALVSGIIACVITLVVVIIILIMKICKERRLRKELDVAGLSTFVQGAMENINPELPVDEQAELLPYDKKWEFPRDKLKL